MLGREVGREDVADVLSEGQGQQGLVLEGKGGLGVCVGGQDGVDPGVEGGAHGERRPLYASRVYAYERGEEDVDGDGHRISVRGRDLDGRVRARHAAVQEVGEVRGRPLAADEARADDRAQVRQGGELGGVLWEQGENGEVELSDAEALECSGGAREVGVDLDLKRERSCKQKGHLPMNLLCLCHCNNP